MKRKEKTVKLVVPKYNMEQEFELRHAERLLRLGAGNGGWELPDNSNYIFKDNGLRLKSDKANSEKTR